MKVETKIKEVVKYLESKATEELRELMTWAKKNLTSNAEGR
jgi:hypothetical protein